MTITLEALEALFASLLQELNPKEPHGCAMCVKDAEIYAHDKFFCSPYCLEIYECKAGI